MKDSKFFVCASCLGRGPGYALLTVSQVDNDGTIYFTDESDVEVELSTEKWKRINAKEFAVPSSKSPPAEHQAWTVIDDIVALHGAVDDAFIEDHLVDATESVFHAIHEYSKNQ